MDHTTAMKMLGTDTALIKAHSSRVAEYVFRECAMIHGGSGLVRGGPGYKAE